MLMRMEGMTTEKRILVNHVSHVDVKTKVNNFGLYTADRVSISHKNIKGAKCAIPSITPKYVANAVSTEKKCTVVNKSIKIL